MLYEILTQCKNTVVGYPTDGPVEIIEKLAPVAKTPFHLQTLLKEKLEEKVGAEIHIWEDAKYSGFFRI